MKRKILALFLVLASAPGCMSAYVKQVGGDVDRSYTRTFIADYETAWDALQDAMKSEKFETSNKEAGFVQTQWGDNTHALNAEEAYYGSAVYVSAHYRMKVHLTKTFFEGVPAVKLSVQKDQMIQLDVLEGQKAMESNGIDEHTFLYRVGRLIYMKLKLAEAEKAKKEQELKNAKF